MNKKAYVLTFTMEKEADNQYEKVRDKIMNSFSFKEKNEIGFQRYLVTFCT